MTASKRWDRVSDAPGTRQWLGFKCVSCFQNPFLNVLSETTQIDENVPSSSSIIGKQVPILDVWNSLHTYVSVCAFCESVCVCVCTYLELRRPWFTIVSNCI